MAAANNCGKNCDLWCVSDLFHGNCGNCGDSAIVQSAAIVAIAHRELRSLDRRPRWPIAIWTQPLGMGCKLVGLGRDWRRSSVCGLFRGGYSFRSEAGLRAHSGCLHGRSLTCMGAGACMRIHTAGWVDEDVWVHLTDMRGAVACDMRGARVCGCE
jgi:hypothetical protein